METEKEKLSKKLKELQDRNAWLEKRIRRYNATIEQIHLVTTNERIMEIIKAAY